MVELIQGKVCPKCGKSGNIRVHYRQFWRAGQKVIQYRCWDCGRLFIDKQENSNDK